MQKARRRTRTAAADTAAAAHATARRPAGLAWGGGLVVLAGLLAWQFWPRPEAVEAAARPAAPAPVLVQTSATGADRPASPVAASDTPTQTVTALPNPKPAPTATPGLAPVKAARAPQPKAAPPKRPVAAPTTAATAPAKAGSEPAVPAPNAAAPAAAPAVAPAPARPRSVDERCADRSNFFTRDLCRVQACGDPALAGDPVCVRFREMEAANRQRADN